MPNFRVEIHVDKEKNIIRREGKKKIEEKHTGARRRRRARQRLSLEVRKNVRFGVFFLVGEAPGAKTNEAYKKIL